MVHALEIIHNLLKPDGELIDIHPVAEPSPVEIHQNGKIDRVGELEVQQWRIDFQEADKALAEIIEKGLYSVEQKGMFDTLTYYDSGAEMGTALKESILKYVRDEVPVDEEVSQVEVLAAQAEELLNTADGEVLLVLREPDHISRLKPM